MGQYCKIVLSSELKHHGILGQKWGVRRYQNADGSLTAAGKKRYDSGEKLEGLNAEDREKARINKEKALKTAAVVGGVALTGAALYLGRRYMASNIDTIIKPGTTIQTIMATKSVDTGRQFYASMHGLDKLRYGAINVQQGGYSKVHKFTAGKQFKIASDKSAEKVFKELIKNDKDFADSTINGLKMLAPYAKADPTRGKTVKKMMKGLDKGNINRSTYDIFNVQLAKGGFDDATKNKFFNALKSKGYAGVKDVNDVKFTNYRSINPMIIFDGKDKFSDIKVSDISDKHTKAGLAIVNSQFYGKILVKTLAPVVAYKTTRKVYNASNDPKLVSEYRKQHPNSKKSYDQILKTVKKKK